MRLGIRLAFIMLVEAEMREWRSLPRFPFLQLHSLVCRLSTCLVNVWLGVDHLSRQFDPG